MKYIFSVVTFSFFISFLFFYIMFFFWDWDFLFFLISFCERFLFSILVFIAAFCLSCFLFDADKFVAARAIKLAKLRGVE